MKKIFIVDTDQKTSYTLQSLFSSKGYKVQAALNPMDCMAQITRFKPDLVLVSYETWGVSSFERARRIEAATPAAVIFIAREVNDMFFNGLQGLKVYAYLKKPVSLAEVYRTSEFALNSVRKINSLQKELTKLEQSLENRRYVERAKLYFMQTYELSETDAYSRLRRMSMDQGLPLHELCRDIVEVLDSAESHSP